MKTMTKRALGLGALLCASTCLASPAFASLDLYAPPPDHRQVDGNGVDLAWGTFNTAEPAVAIGPAGPDGLSFQRSYIGQGWRDNVTGTMTHTGISLDQTTVSLGAMSDTFKLSDTTFQYYSINGTPSTFVCVPADHTCTWTTPDGTAVTYDMLTSPNSQFDSSLGRVTTVQYPRGEILRYYYRNTQDCGNSSCAVGRRLQSVTSNLGYQIKFGYELDNSTDGGFVAIADWGKWTNMTSATAFNMTVRYCDPAGLLSACSLPAGDHWPKATYTATTTASTTTNALGKTTSYVYSTDQRMTQITSPVGRVTSIAYDSTTHLVDTVSDGVGTWNYDFVDTGSGVNAVRTSTVTAPAVGGVSAQKVITASLPKGGLILSEKEITGSGGAGNTTTYVYSPVPVHLTDIVRQDGLAKSGSTDGQDSTHLDYDSRGNLTLVTVYPKHLTGTTTPSNITISYSYAADCTSTPLTWCNKPQSITDANGKVTNITYTSGGLVDQVTLPVPSSTNTTRPRINYDYDALQAHYNRFGNGIEAGEQHVAMLSRVATCMTGTASDDCATSSTGAVTQFTYGSATTSVANNLLPTVISRGTGNTTGTGALRALTTLAWTNQGDLATSDGPLGTSTTLLYDQTAFFYDDLRRKTGVILPRGDGGAGSAPLRAVRYSYDDDNLLTKTERGTTAGQTATDFASFTVKQYTQTTYSATTGLPIRTTLTQTGTRASTEYKFDAARRLQCATADMTPTTTMSDACSLDSGSADDRITKYGYDQAGRLSTITTGFGATEAQTVTYTYDAWDQVATLSDGLNNLTTYDYDHFHRVADIRFPSTTTAGTSSTTDKEIYSYDPNSNVVEITRRDGDVIDFTFDGLNRVTAKAYSSSSGLNLSDNVTYQYDNLSRMTQAQTTTGTGAQTLTFSYDALGRRTHEVGALGDVESQYDLAGNRTKLIWPGGTYYVNYDYDWTGMLTAVRENNATSGAGVLAEYTYDDLARITRLDRADGAGAPSTYKYNDTVGQTPWLTRINHKMTDPDNIQIDFTNNAAGQIVTRALSAADVGSSADTYAWTRYSAVDRTYNNNGLNQLTSTVVGSTTTNYTYDTGGNLTSDSATTYKYDSDNRMTQAVGQVNLAYDPAGRLFRTAGASTTKYLYDGNEVIAEYANNGTTLLRRYVRGNGSDQPLVVYDPVAYGGNSWPVPDERGSIIALSSSTGAMVAANTYDEFGVPGTGNTGAFQYTGQQWLPDAGLDHYKARAYSPNLGRFMQTDPIGYNAGTNLYAYADGDPVNLVDPSGTTVESLWDWFTGKSQDGYPTGVEYQGPGQWGREPGGDGGSGGTGHRLLSVNYVEEVLVHGTPPIRLRFRVGGDTQFDRYGFGPLRGPLGPERADRGGGGQSGEGRQGKRGLSYCAQTAIAAAVAGTGTGVAAVALQVAAASETEAAATGELTPLAWAGHAAAAGAVVIGGGATIWSILECNKGG